MATEVEVGAGEGKARWLAAQRGSPPALAAIAPTIVALTIVNAAFALFCAPSVPTIPLVGESARKSMALADGISEGMNCYAFASSSFSWPS